MSYDYERVAAGSPLEEIAEAVRKIQDKIEEARDLETSVRGNNPPLNAELKAEGLMEDIVKECDRIKRSSKTYASVTIKNIVTLR